MDSKDGHKNRSNFLVGVVGGWAICHSGPIFWWGWWEVGLSVTQVQFFGGGGGRLGYLSLRFLWRIQIWVKNTKKSFDPLTRPPRRPFAAGPSIRHLSPVTRGGGGGGGGYVLHWWTEPTGLERPVMPLWLSFNTFVGA